MNDQKTFRHIASLSAFLAALFIVASSVVLLIAVDFNSEFMSHPEGLITLSVPASETFRLGTILELGSTLFLVPVALYLWFWLKPRASKLVTLYTVLGLASMLLAITGELLRANLYPPLMNAYSQAPELQKDVLITIFQGITNLNFQGLWALELTFWGTWWLGIGPLLRSERLILGTVTMILGIGFLVAGAGWLLRVDSLARLENAFFLVPFWIAWLGIVIWRHDEEHKHVMEVTTAD